MKNIVHIFLTALLVVVFVFDNASFIYAGGGGTTGGTTGGQTTTVVNVVGGAVSWTQDSNGNVTSITEANCTNCTTGAGSTGGGGGGGGAFGGGSPSPAPAPAPSPSPTPPPPIACTLTANPYALTTANPVTTLTWSPTPAGVVSGSRTVQAVAVHSPTSTEVAKMGSVSQTASLIEGNQIAFGGGGSGSVGAPAPVLPAGNLTIPNGATSITDTIPNPVVGTYTYTITYNNPIAMGNGPKMAKEANAEQSASLITGKQVAFGGGGSPPPPPPLIQQYTCNVSVGMVAALTECDDGIDNADAEDTLIDYQDPGCHTDGNSMNPFSYDANRTSEDNLPADMVPTISSVAQVAALSAVWVTASAKNVGAVVATPNELVYGWRDTSGVGACSGSVGSGGPCFTINGKTYTRLSTFSQLYFIGQSLADAAQVFIPPTQGTYELCAVADYSNTVPEGVAGEQNNSTCRTLNVTAPLVVVSPPPTGALTLFATPARVRSGQTTTITWDTGGRTQCTLTGSSGQTISLVGAASASSAQSSPIVAETKYTLSCLDDNSKVDITIKIVPQYKEI